MYPRLPVYPHGNADLERKQVSIEVPKEKYPNKNLGLIQGESEYPALLEDILLCSETLL